MKWQLMYHDCRPQPELKALHWPQLGLLILSLLSWGCNAGEPALSGVIGGRVVRSGQPVTSGRVELHGNDTDVVVAEIDENGSYSMDSIQAGDYHVAIISERVPEKFADPQTSGLTLQMEAGTGPLIADFEIP